MSSMAPDEGIDPTTEEVLQSEIPDYPSVRVVVETPVRTQELPYKHGEMSSVTIGDTVDTAYTFREDPRRGRLTLIAKDSEVLLARSQAALRNGAEWPAGVPIVMRHTEEVWVMAADGEAKLSWIYEARFD